MPLPQLLLIFLVGILAGAIAAICGIGGGILMVPALVWLFRFPQKEAVATSLAAIVLISIAGSLRNHINGLIHWPAALTLTLAGAITSFFAADLLKHLSNTTLTRIFAILLILTGFHLLLSKTQN
ncbi:MAG: sulfite exporter TauE/SafE family protein [Chthoniobacterales bacterium]|nr:sulfite exporter TauE/SafE family protein [Chthoniobacterales bacterium]